jgi:uncharacterized delta-60 repeat protein
LIEVTKKFKLLGVRLVKIIYSFVLVITFCLISFAGAGDLDLTFNGTGKVATEINNGAVGFDVAVQKDGNIVVVGRSVSVSLGTNFDFTAVRYNEDGSIDTTFGNNGKVIFSMSQNDDIATKVLIQKDGKILLAGYSVTPSFNGSKITLLRLNSDGLPDSSFGTNGVVRLLENSPVGLAFNGGRLEIIETKQGKILVGGTIFLEEGVSTQAAIFSLNVDGSYNTAFRGDGKLLEPALLSGSFLDFALTSESNIFVLSRTQFGGYILSNFKRNGEINTHVANGNGFVFVTQNPNLNFSNLEIQKNSDVFVSGTASFTGTSGAIETDLFVYKYGRNLDLDTSFGLFGQTQISIFPVDSLADVEIQNDGKILLLGSGVNPANNTSDFSLTRLNSNGSIDSSFGNSVLGTVTTDFFANSAFAFDGAGALTIHKNRAIAVGATFPNGGRRSFAVSKYLLH